MDLIRSAVLALLVGCVVSTGMGQLQDASLPTRAICAARKKGPIPEGDELTSAHSERLAGCDASKLYYGIGEKVDFIAARQCAYAERANGNQEVFGGSAILMMLYANGDGVPRNFRVAEKFACESGGAPAEIDGRMEHLRKLQQAHWTGKNFDLCDDITSGYMGGRCSLLNSQIQAAKRDNSLDAIVRTWSPADQSAFKALRAEANKFFSQRSEDEVDQSGTMGPAFVIEEEKSLQNGFFAAVQRFERGKLPNYSRGDFQRANVELNLVYAQAKKRSLNMGTVTLRGIQQTERAWIRYREAWVGFGAVKYPSVSADSWRTWLTQERTTMLRKLTLSD
jgi:uncharacterized protein YecT (DUF1311 family)